LRTWSMVGAIALSGALIGGGYSWGLRTSRTPAAPAATAGPSEGDAIQRRLDDLDQRLSMIARLVGTAVQRRDEGSPADNKARVAVSPARAAEKTPSSTIPDDPMRAAASVRARQILERAISARQWSVEDREAWQAERGQIDDGTRMEVIRRLSAAINSGEVQVKTIGPAL
jgi:hypothetical protein